MQAKLMQTCQALERSEHVEPMQYVAGEETGMLLLLLLLFDSSSMTQAVCYTHALVCVMLEQATRCLSVCINHKETSALSICARYKDI